MNFLKSLASCSSSNVMETEADEALLADDGRLEAGPAALGVGGADGQLAPTSAGAIQVASQQAMLQAWLEEIGKKFNVRSGLQM